MMPDTEVIEPMFDKSKFGDEMMGFFVSLMKMLVLETCCKMKDVGSIVLYLLVSMMSSHLVIALMSERPKTKNTIY